jgi:SAM-dependent methyltransferase
VSDADPTDFVRPLSHLAPEEKAERAGSFGEVATHYERFRPGPPEAAVDWLLPEHVSRVVDLGAGTGALTRLLVGRADEVIAVEPDDRMRSVLVEEVPGITALKGRGESMPIGDGTVDAVLASSSWHWMDPIPALHEVGRILVPGGILGAVWSGPDPEGPFLVQARALLAGGDGEGDGAEADNDGTNETNELSAFILGDGSRPSSTLEIPPGVPFAQPDHEIFQWDVPLNADDLIGLLGTFSWIILMPEDQRNRVVAEARRVLNEVLGIQGDVTVDVAFRAEAYRSRRS